MAGFLSNIKTKFSEMFSSESDSEELLSDGDKEYVELDTSGNVDKSKVLVRTFTIEDFQDVKAILDVLREGSTIALVNIRPLKDKDQIELKRAVNKLKKTTDAIGGDIAGLGDDYVIVTPSFAKVFKSRPQSAQQMQAQQMKVEEEAL